MNTTFERYARSTPLTILFLLLAVLAFNIWFYHYGPLNHRIYSPLMPEDSTVFSRELLSDSPPHIEIDKTTQEKLPSNIALNLERGETLSTLFAKINVNKYDAQAAIKAITKVYKVSALQTGQHVQIDFDSTASASSSEGDRRLSKMVIFAGASNVEVIRQGNVFKAQLVKAVLQEKRRFISGRISGSLYSAAIRSGANASMVANFMKLFSYTTDFQRDIRSGDKFEFLTTYYTDAAGKRVRDGEILYASLSSNGKTKSIYRFDRGASDVDYYDQHGNSIRKTLLRTPINGARVSSGYGMRQHPILGYSRMHKGLDYAASRGTPIGAAGDGVVQSIRNQPNGYGKHLIIKHNNKYTTLYAHLDRVAKGIYSGKKVKQGEVIAYVGSSGMSTGPHLHYEVLVMGKQVNPAKVSFAKVPPLKGKMLEKFQQMKKSLEHSINRGVS